MSQLQSFRSQFLHFSSFSHCLRSVAQSGSDAADVNKAKLCSYVIKNTFNESRDPVTHKHNKFIFFYLNCCEMNTWTSHESFLCIDLPAKFDEYKQTSFRGDNHLLLIKLRHVSLLKLINRERFRFRCEIQLKLALLSA
jgi:hypothetical protein